MDYTEMPGHTSSHTSKDAAEIVREDTTPLREQVFALLNGVRSAGSNGNEGCTSEELGMHLRQNASPEEARKWINPRVAELRAMGKIKDSGKTRKNSSGLEAIVWTVGADLEYIKKRLTPKPVGNKELWGQMFATIHAYAATGRIEDKSDMLTASEKWVNDMAHRIYMKNKSI